MPIGVGFFVGGNEILDKKLVVMVAKLGEHLENN